MAVNGIPFLLYSTGSGTVAPPPPDAGYSPMLQKAGHGPAHSFTRKRYKELLAALAAKDALEAKASEAKGKQRARLEKVSKAAANVLADIEDAEIDVERLTAALQAAAMADRMKTTLAMTREVERAITELREQMEDEEEAIMLLLH